MEENWSTRRKILRGSLRSTKLSPHADPIPGPRGGKRDWWPPCVLAWWLFCPNSSHPKSFLFNVFLKRSNVPPKCLNGLMYEQIVNILSVRTEKHSVHFCVKILQACDWLQHKHSRHCLLYVLMLLCKHSYKLHFSYTIPLIRLILVLWKLINFFVL